MVTKLRLTLQNGEDYYYVEIDGSIDIFYYDEDDYEILKSFGRSYG